MIGSCVYRSFGILPRSSPDPQILPRSSPDRPRPPQPRGPAPYRTATPGAISTDCPTQPGSARFSPAQPGTARHSAGNDLSHISSDPPQPRAPGARMTAVVATPSNEANQFLRALLYATFSFDTMSGIKLNFARTDGK